MRMLQRLLAVAALTLFVAACDQTIDEPAADNPPADTAPDSDADSSADTPDTDEPSAESDDSDYLHDSEGRTFSYLPVGDILPNSGPGDADPTIYRPDMLFPLEDAGFLNSQVYRYGGSKGSLNGMEGGQCEPANYDYPWQDTFCESRSREQIMCPDGGHEGVDIRPAGCIPETHGDYWAVAVEDGRIVGLSGSKYTVKLQTDDGTLYRYLHLKMDELAVSDGDYVTKGQRIGKVSNDFYNSAGEKVATTYHLHFELYQNYAADEDAEPVFDQVNPYMSLVNAYEKKLRGAE